MFPLQGKKPATPNGYKDASRDPEKIRAMFKRAGNRATGYGIATGQASGVVVVDVDGPRGRAEAEKRNLRAEYVVKTGRPEGDGWHAYFGVPGDASVKSRTIAPGLEVKGEGAYVVGPGSRHPSGAGYELAKGGHPSPLPEWAIVPEQERSERDESRGGRRTVAIDEAGPKIPEGGRDRELTRIAGRLHDGTRTLEDLARDLTAINAARCDPPMPYSQVLKIARSIHGREPYRPGGATSPEVAELVEALEAWWWGERFPKVGGKTMASFLRALIREGERVGTAIPGVGLRVSLSVRNAAEIVGCHRNTIENLTKRAREAGILRKDGNGRGKASAFVLLDPRQVCDTQPPGATPGGVSQVGRASVTGLRTPHYRWRGLVGKGKEHTLCTLEAFGPQDEEELAVRLGWSRPRDLRLHHLEPLAALGLIEKRNGKWELLDALRVLDSPYSTLQPRVRRERSAEGRFVYVVKDSGMIASEAERARLDREKHEREREAFSNPAAPDLHYVNVGADGYVWDLEPIGDESGGQPSLSALAMAIRSYLEARPWDAGQPAGWLGVTLWCEGWHPKLKDPPAETRAALEELGGARYLADRLQAKDRARVAGAA